MQRHAFHILVMSRRRTWFSGMLRIVDRRHVLHPSVLLPPAVQSTWGASIHIFVGVMSHVPKCFGGSRYCHSTHKGSRSVCHPSLLGKCILRLSVPSLSNHFVMCVSFAVGGFRKQIDGLHLNYQRINSDPPPCSTSKTRLKIQLV